MLELCVFVELNVYRLPWRLGHFLSLLLFAGPPHTTRREKMMRLLLFPSLVLFFLFCVHVNPPKDDGQESSWPLNDVMAVECQLSPFPPSPRRR